MFQKVFKAGKYGDFEVTTAMLQEIADSYDTTYKKSPINIDHWGGESYGWIEAVQVTGEFLEANINFTDEGKALLATGKYKYPSVEFADYDGVPYLRAIALTNYNRVKSLPQLQYSETNIRRFAEPSCKFNIDKSFNENINQNTNIKMKNLIKQLAGLFSVNYSETMSDETVLEAVIESAGDAIGKVRTFSDAGITVEKYKALETEIAAFSDKRAEDLVNSAVELNKINPAQKEKYLKLAKADYDSVSEIFSEMKQGNAFSKNFIKDRSAAGENGGKSGGKSGDEIKYEDIIKNPELQANYSEEELEVLREEYLRN